MTIKYLELFHFESYKSCTLEFDPGVNIITGLSGHGKSSIIRGFDWIFNNSPGEEMLSYVSEGLCTAGIVFENDHGIARLRGGANNKNEYFLTETEETFKALRGKVPEQVSTLVNMNEVNLQAQKDFYFMLMNSPGQVARMFNKVSGLEEMDAAQTTINSMHKEKKKSFDILISRSTDLNERLDNLDWVKQADADYTKIEILSASVDEIGIKILTIETLIHSIMGIKQEISFCKDVSAIPQINEIFKVEEELINVEEDIHKLQKLVDDCSQLKKDINNIRLPDKDRLDDITSMRQLNEDIKDEIASLNFIIHHVENFKEEIDQSSIKIDDLQSQYTSFLIENGNCPTCGTKMEAL